MKSILLVDDNKDVTDILSVILTGCMRNVLFRTASNGREAVEILKRQPVDLILTDINMPVMNGYGLIEYRNKNHPSVPLVAMTADASPDVNRRLAMLGITECLEKPFSYDMVTKVFREKLADIDEPEPVHETALAVCR